ncbi:hypothetical protein GCM10022246_24730 [Pedobacter ginsengiterrae]|uniref:Uncharacterized protein n=1 Tax=Pedobacter ginsengiterrae TaxID=871696 RepID=A0ABP7PUS9_9SPHI
MAENKDSYISKFKPTSHFFINPDVLSQTESQSFGPVDENEYRLTTKFTVGSGVKTAFAICKGIVLVQRQTGSTGLVNLILRPFTQPIEGFNIKYFIYRGLVEADFFNGNKVLTPTSSTSDFVNQINASFVAFHNSTDPGQQVPDFLAKYIGFEPVAQADNLPLSDFFFKESVYVESNGEFVEKDTEAFELPVIDMGKSLGNFQAGECGIDIVLNYGDYRLPTPNDEFVFDLSYARAKEAKIVLNNTMSEFQKKLKKEHIFQFLDAAAFFGFHYSNGSIAIGNAVKKGADIYNDVISKFSYKNRLYLYIQSDRGRSYNFYNNYLIGETGAESLKIGLSENTLADAVYATQGWPVIIKDNLEGMLYLQFVTDNNENSMLYGQIANIDNAVKNNFIDAEYLKLPDTVDGTPNDFTKSIVLSNAALSMGGNLTSVANFNILIFQGKANYYISGQETDEQNVTTDILAKANFFDDVFDLVSAEPLFKADQTSGYSVLSSQKLKLVNHFFDKRQLGISGVQTVNVQDSISTSISNPTTLSRVTYVTETVDLLNSGLSVTGTITPDTRSNPSTSKASNDIKTYQLPDTLYYTLESFTDSSEIINGLILNAKDGSTPTKIILGLTTEENNAILSLIVSKNLIYPRLFLVDLFDGGNEFVSIENIKYQKYSLGVVGEIATGALRLYTPLTSINIYSLDRKYHFSKAYSEYMEDLTPENSFTITNKIG